MKRRPIRDHGAKYLRKTVEYHLSLTSFRKVKRVRIAAQRGIPRKTATDLATVE